jgi:hypothetical protein
MADEQRYVLGLAYAAGPDPLIKRGADGHRDYFTADELEKAARTFLRKGAMQVGIMHVDGTVGHAEVVESYIWPSEDPFIYKGEIVANKGDWLLGMLLDEQSWALVKSGQLTGFSPQGSGKRRTAA